MPLQELTVESMDYTVVPDKLEDHIAKVRELAGRLRAVADPVAALGPSAGARWTGNAGSAAMLRACLVEIAEVMRRTSDGVTRYADRAAQCRKSYVSNDRTGAENLRKCLTDLRR